jgi:DMSO/TMAO reductase YedYZ molybdopterin-dependent catalytic subunit
MDRRTFVGTSLAVLAGSSTAKSQEGSVIPAGKDPRLGVVAANPLVLETPENLLVAQRITPTSALFVRQHHGAVPFNRMASVPLAGWMIAVHPSTGPSIKLDARLLTELPSVDVEMVLQCSGNNRAQFSAISPIKGTPWNKGGVGNVVFAGPKFSTFLEKLGLQPDSSTRYFTFSGSDEPEKDSQDDFEHSIPVDDCLKYGMLATHLNGEPLPAIHGGPVRLVMPGYFGSMHIKWLNRIKFDQSETTTFFQMKDYRLPNDLVKPGAPFEFTSRNSSPHYRINVNSRFFSPVQDAKVSGGAVHLTGVAWTDGRAPLESVLVSTDHGQTWQRAMLDAETSPFAWRPWTATVALSNGTHEAWVRAIDALGRSQPLDGTRLWNPGGYGWNVVDRVRFQVG